MGRRAGFCKDFTGREHILPDKITGALYPSGTSPKRPKRALEETTSVNPVDLLEAFVNRHMVADGASVSITNLTKKKKGEWEFGTSYECQGCHVRDVPFIIKGTIKQKCKCKTRAHVLTDKIIKVL